MAEYIIKREDGAVLGVWEEAQVWEMLRDGRVRPGDFCHTGEMPRWMPVGEVFREPDPARVRPGFSLLRVAMVSAGAVGMLVALGAGDGVSGLALGVFTLLAAVAR